MNNNRNPLTLPTQAPRRHRTLNMRLSETERAAVIKLAEMQGVTLSALARHFVLQAVAYYQETRMQGEVVHDPET